ncbi:hypothetical protein AVEN_4245-1 [Araneus ventricosus]|uniref:Uncharacterized protein n=1 Tax=Araneus ventricosus TaxID=182803 RepID=A0A4Y2U7Z6_ARAVE|nr:hypothetical protein AVEN_95794-1 [Araneus ventricosus]GBO08782.1 hypothetical protein AVEN_4245-1 [Araneus ventricosus]
MSGSDLVKSTGQFGFQSDLSICLFSSDFIYRQRRMGSQGNTLLQVTPVRECCNIPYKRQERRHLKAQHRAQQPCNEWQPKVMNVRCMKNKSAEDEG